MFSLWQSLATNLKPSKTKLPKVVPEKALAAYNFNCTWRTMSIHLTTCTLLLSSMNHHNPSISLSQDPDGTAPVTAHTPEDRKLNSLASVFPPEHLNSSKWQNCLMGKAIKCHQDHTVRGFKIGFLAKERNYKPISKKLDPVLQNKWHPGNEPLTKVPEHCYWALPAWGTLTSCTSIQSIAAYLVPSECAAEISEGHLWQVEATCQTEQFFGRSWSCKAAPGFSADAFVKLLRKRVKKCISIKEFVLGLSVGQIRVCTRESSEILLSWWFEPAAALSVLWEARCVFFCESTPPSCGSFSVSAQEKAERFSVPAPWEQAVQSFCWMLPSWLKGCGPA